MSCNCKNGDSFDTELKNEKKVSLWNNIISYFFKTLGFIILLAFLPIINLVIIWIMFKAMVLNKKLEIRPLLKYIGEMIKQKDNEYDDDDDDDYDYSYSDLKMVDVEDITNKKD